MQNENTIIDQLKARLQEQAPTILPKNLLEVVVDLAPSRLFQDAARVYSLESQRVTRFTGNDNFVISENEFERYFITLLYLRVMRVNNVQNNVTNMYRGDIRNYYVPAFVHTLLTSIGIAVDRDFGFKFVPSVTVEADMLLSAQEMRMLSDKLSFLSREGLTCVDTGISVRPEGELSFMAVLNISEEVLSYKKDHPVYGFYASFFKHQVVDSVINPSHFRIRYGSEDEYATYVKYIV